MTLGHASRRSFLLVYSSQTGQAQAIAEEVAEKAAGFGLDADIHCVSTTEKKFWLDRESCVVFITSTTGDGEPPETALKFWRRLKKKTLPGDHLKQLNYALLGLGDSNYTSFCKCGKMIDKRFQELGASAFYPSQFADDATGLETVVEPWMDGLFPALIKFLGLSSHNSSDLDNAPRLANDYSEQSADISDSVKVQSLDSGDNNQPTDLVKNKQPTDLVKNNQPTDSAEAHSSSTLLSEQVNIRPSNNPVPVNVDMTESSISSPALNPASNTQTDKSLTASNLSTDLDKIHLNKDCAVDHSRIATNKESLGQSCPPLANSSLSLPVLTPRYIATDFRPELKIATDGLPLHNGAPFPSAASGVENVPLVAAQVMTQDDAIKKTLKVTVDISETCWCYEPGDAFGIVCPNNDHEINDLIKRLGVTDCADTPCILSVMDDTKKRNAAIPAHLPPHGTIRHWLTTCCDIRTPPKKALTRALVEYSEDVGQRRRLQELCSKQGAEIYNRLVREAGMSLMDVLTAFPSCTPPIGLLLEHLPRLAARPYSAASWQDQAALGRVDFVFNVVQIPANAGKPPRQGVCTGWLNHLSAALQPSSVANDKKEHKITIPVFLRSNQHFRPPGDVTNPLILIGPGTGVAPFIGFLQQRHSVRTAQDAVNVGDCWLLFGCRHQKRDYLFRSELEGFLESGTLSRLLVCFSRDSQDDSKPRYVQDNIRLHGNELSQLITTGGAHVYVCGDAKNMAGDVRKTMRDILHENTEMTTKDAESFINDLVIREKRYHEDIW